MNKMKILNLVVLLFLVQTVKCQNDFLLKKPIGEPTTLLGITGVNSIFSDSTEIKAAIGGGLEMERMFSTQIYPNLKPCNKEIHSTFTNWIKENNLVTAKNIFNENYVSFEVWTSDYEGLFELKYVCSNDGSYARTWIDYYKITGESLAVETITELYINYKISDLWDNIQKSMGCGVD